MRAMIVDDEPLARDGLRLLLAEYPDVELVGEAGNGADALALVDRTRPELVFIDVQMPEMSGLELAARLPEPAPAVVFVTAHDTFALRAFDVHALDYVLKPIDEQRFAEAIRRARITVSAIRTPARLAIRDGEAIVFVPIEDIDWIEAADYYVEITPARERTCTARPCSACRRCSTPSGSCASIARAWSTAIACARSAGKAATG